MIDRGLLLTLALMALVLLGAVRLAPPRTLAGRAVWDEAALAGFVGTLAGRLAALAFDDPAGLLRIRDIPLFRGGVEFWPGAAAVAAVLLIDARRREVGPVARLADLLPYELLLYGTYEAACLLRDGCFGPVSLVGLVPRGVGVREFPVDLALGVAVGGVALAVRRVGMPTVALVVGVGSLAWLRFVASFWLPRLGVGLGRPAVESFIVAVLVSLVGALVWVRVGRRRHGTVAPTSASVRSYDTMSS